MNALTIAVGTPMKDEAGDHDDGSAGLGAKFVKRFFEHGERGEFERAYECLCRAVALAEDEEEDDESSEDDAIEGGY